MMAPVYLDYNATTPVAPEVAQAMQPFLHEAFGNPSSSHAYGAVARDALARARAQVAALVGATPDEIAFTGCATEANNLALIGVAHALEGSRRHLVVSAVEHPAVMAPARWLEAHGWELTVVPVDGHGLVAPDAVAAALRPDTALVSVMHANNEVGTIQPVAAIARIAHAHGALLHTDAAQSAGKIALDVEALGADLLTLAGHKFYATKGVGALYVRRGTPIRPALHGAGQEHGLRPGTENVPAIVGLGVAAELAAQRLPQAPGRLRALRDRLHTQLAAAIPGVALNGHPELRLPNTLHVSLPGASGRALLERAGADVAASVGSACHADDETVSGVLAAMGIDAAGAAAAIRLSVGWMSTADEIDRAAAALVDAWREVAAR